MQCVFQVQRHRQASGRLAVAVAAAANMVPVAASRQRTATETVTAGNAARDGAEVLGLGEGPTFGRWVRRRVPARARLWRGVGRRPGRRRQHRAPSRAGWSKDAGGRPEPKGTAHPRVGHRRLPGGPAQTAWESPGLNWHSQTTGYRNRSSEADRGPPEKPTPWRSRTRSPDRPPVSWCPSASRPLCPKRRTETARCPTSRTRGQKGLRQRLCPPQPKPLPLLLKGRS